MTIETQNGPIVLTLDWTPGMTTVNRVLAGHTSPAPVRCEEPVYCDQPQPAYRWATVGTFPNLVLQLVHLDGTVVASLAWSDELQSEVATIVGLASAPCDYNRGVLAIARRFGCLTPPEHLEAGLSGAQFG